MLSKTELRKRYKTLRTQFTSEARDSMSMSIANHALQLPIWQYAYYHIFLPIEKQKEVDTGYLLSILHGRDKEVVIPKSDFSTLALTSILLTENTHIQENEFGIPEPIDGLTVPENAIDVVFVPLLAFDKQGNRIGYGKGFYDRFLSECRKDVVKVGLSFFDAEEHIEVSKEDVPLNFCVTPDKTYNF